MHFNLSIQDTLERLLNQEDTNGDKKITIEDHGPKKFILTADNGSPYEIKGTYYLSNLLQELIITQYQGKSEASFSLQKIEEPPVNRISRMIKDYYWDGLTRTLDLKGLEKLASDSKTSQHVLYIYVPHEDPIALDYFQTIQHNSSIPIEVIQLPKEITPEYVLSLNDKSGILSLVLTQEGDTISGLPFIVPGGRFNEMYGWDSYFEAIGLLTDGKIELAKALADHFQYQINHYGKILNANRSYYLTRTQPPFYTSLIKRVYQQTQDKNWLKNHLTTAIKEYETVWMQKGKRLTANELNRYYANGIGLPPETEEGHYDVIIEPYAKAAHLSTEEYTQQYLNRKIENEELDRYFIHDRSVRESGHDTSYRLEGICADLNPVELNAMLYRYEIDFAEWIKQEFNNHFEIEGVPYTAEKWFMVAQKRKELINQYCWNEETGLYFDFNHKTQTPHRFVSAMTFAPLWAGICSAEQAKKLVKTGISLLKEKGGIAGSTKESRGEITATRPQRQWDYPNGWAPHQMMIWEGLAQYGFEKELQELVYRWLFMITKNAVDYNGTIPEKYDVVEASHKVFAEYGNVGVDFEYITQEGFGWMNASYQYGLTFLTSENIDSLNLLIDPDTLF